MITGNGKEFIQDLNRQYVALNQNSMTAFNVLLLIVLCIWIIVMYNKYSPKIDIVTSRDRYIILLWYNKWYWNEECKRTYIKLFEV